MFKLQGIKNEGGSEEWNKGTEWSAEVLDLATMWKRERGSFIQCKFTGVQ